MLCLELYLLKRLVVAKAAVAGPVPVVLPRTLAQPTLPAASDRSGSRTRILAQPATTTDAAGQTGR